MAEVLDPVDSGALVVHTAPVIQLDNQQFFDFCQINRELKIERTSEGDLVIMAPAGGSSGSANAELIYLFKHWERHDRSGRVFDSSTGFNLPNGATRSPDVSWVRNERIEPLSEEDWNRFLPLCPDFVLELRSPSDSLRELQAKMQEYITNGAQLGWLLDAPTKTVYIYRTNQSPEILENPARLQGDPVLNGFVLNLHDFWRTLQRNPI